MKNRLIIHNAHLVTPIGCKARKGSEMGNLKEIPDALIAVEDGVITFVGAATDFGSLPKSGYQIIDANGKVVLPGFVDSHTHLVFGGYRPDEFEWRLKGESYMSIMERGGGIQSTVNSTRDADVNDLFDKALWFINRMCRMGVTTVEAKSGYGLDLDSEIKMLEVIHRLSADDDTPLRVVGTFLGAHAVPKEYKGRTEEYIDLMIEKMFPEARKYADFCDIFTEKNVFEIEESRRFMQAAKDAGFKLKFHADEIVTLGGAELAAELGAVSADHLLHVSDLGIERMAESGTVATLLPLTAFAFREPYAPARKFIDRGCAVALATDLNPGSCFSGSIPLTIALACIYMNMSIEETITALTLNGAAALDLAESTGSIEEGKSADLILLEFDNYRMLPYYIGMNCVKTVISRGRIVAEN